MSIAEVIDPPISHPPLVPPFPPRAPENMGRLARIAAIRTSTIASWGQRAYEDDIIRGRFFGHSSFILNTPATIRHCGSTTSLARSSSCPRW